jgi:hypothetical protein
MIKQAFLLVSLTATLTAAMPRIQAGTPSKQTDSKQSKTEKVTQSSPKAVKSLTAPQATKAKLVDSAKDSKVETDTKAETDSAQDMKAETEKISAESKPAAIKTTLDKQPEKGSQK